MYVLQQSLIANRILSRLSVADLSLLAPLLEPVTCSLGQVLVEQDVEIAYTYFLESGVASLVSPEGQGTEGGIVGREGYIIPATLLGSKTVPFRVEMQMAGTGHRIQCAAMQAASDASASLRDVLLRFAHILMVQMTYSVLANATHTIEERLARRLLMCHDRLDGNELALTHYVMAVMLSVRRPSVTNALHVLEGKGFIRSHRGYVVIRDRAALAIFAADAYGKPETEYRRLLGPV